MDEYKQDRYMNLLDTIAVPELELEHAILEGKRRAEQEARDLRLRKLKLRLISGAMAASIVIAFIIGIRVSPVFASSLANIPVVAELVELIAGNQDKGMQDIVDNEYYEVIDQTVTKNGLELTLKGVIADESGMIIYYRVAANDPELLDSVDLRGISLLHGGKEMGTGFSYSFFHQDGDLAIEDEIRVHGEGGLDYSSKQFELELTFTDEHKTVMTIPFELKQPIAETKSYSIAKEVVINDQKIWIDELNISPLRAELKLRADESNSMRLLSVRSLELIDEHGEQWGAASGGVISMGTFDEKGYSLYIESNYFRDPQKLTLRLGEIEALPKGQDYIEVDFEQQKVLYQSPYMEGQLSVNNDSLIYVGAEWLNEQYIASLFSTGIDANGETVNFSSSSASSGEVFRTTHRFVLEDHTNPIRFPIVAYPNYLSDTIEVDIPMADQ
ncbi:DUF4179 domain-containing protein [Paenibacillus camelliae]|uniref:DUF4179 domain-containing protein n=1 Tax=Paenibacillus camelliae TaxID=512410 RepID=UPI00203BDB07|nr:DUF4179 domain-containing protein [Paenibacillus camelliae]MCM3635555.1 DUF4179 domain-containing protein [Paenibacillus camelliae]